MLRVRFGRDDLARLRFVISPMGETILSLSAVQLTDPLHPLARWRAVQHDRLASAPSRALLGLVPPGWRPEVALAPVVSERPLFEEELDAVLDFSPRPVRAYLSTLRSPAAFDRWVSALPTDSRGERQLLSGLLVDYHRRCVAEYWPSIRLDLEADVAGRRRLHAELGVGRLLGTLHPTIRWNDPILEIGVPGPSRHLDLDGRGLVLVPSAFLWPYPTVLRDGRGQHVLIYPAREVISLWSAPGDARDVLTALLGPTRAAVLLASAGGGSTSSLAGQLSISLPSASQHLSVLREAGLVRSTRRGQSVLHDLTPLGAQLLLVHRDPG